MDSTLRRRNPRKVCVIVVSTNSYSFRVHQDEVEYKFQSSFQDTILIIKCRKGEAIFKSDNISVISIIKDVISKEAIERKTLIDVNFGNLYHHSYLQYRN